MTRQSFAKFTLTAALLHSSLAALATEDTAVAKPANDASALGKPAVGIPFSEALRRADVEVPAMKDGQRESLILGNGDLYGIVWEKDNGLFMRITKNDIWDARVDTSKDGDLPRVDPVTREVTGLDGAPPSYSLPYPQPRCAVALRLGPVPEKMSGHLNLEKALVTIKSGEKTHTALRILYQQNVLLIRGPHPVVLEEIKAGTLPAAKLGETDGVSWLLMNMPGDIDYKGMDYAVAVATRGDLKAVSLVTSFDPGSGDVLARAIALASQAVEEKEVDLIAKHEQAWRDYWARCGVELGDQTLERWWYRMLYFAGTVCRPGAAPVPILPPLATDNTPWHADFHHNYNTWQAYWPLPAANHSELVDPWISNTCCKAWTTRSASFRAGPPIRTPRSAGCGRRAAFLCRLPSKTVASSRRPSRAWPRSNWFSSVRGRRCKSMGGQWRSARTGCL